MAVCVLVGVRMLPTARLASRRLRRRYDSVVLVEYSYLEDPFAAVASQSLTLEIEPSIKQRSSESLSLRAGRIGVTARLRCIPSDLSARVLSGTDDEKRKVQTEIRKIQK